MHPRHDALSAVAAGTLDAGRRDGRNARPEAGAGLAPPWEPAAACGDCAGTSLRDASADTPRLPASPQQPAAMPPPDVPGMGPPVRQPIVPTQAAVLLADIRGFTTLLATHPPRLMVGLLNRFLAAMCAAADRYGGHVDKFMGDAVMVVFGVPHRRGDDLHRALACAVAMQQAMARLNRGHQRRGEPALYAGIAVHAGAVMAGSFGPPRHQAYTVVGDTVNLAARIEAFSLRGQVLISEAVRAVAGDLIGVGPGNRVQPKGLPGALMLYPLLTVEHRGRLSVPVVEPRRSPRVPVELEAVFRPVRAKRLDGESFSGRVRDIGYHGLSAHLPRPLPSLTELAISLPATSGAAPPGDLYARVLRIAREAPGYRTSLAFTAVDTPAHRELKALVDERLWRR